MPSKISLSNSSIDKKLRREAAEAMARQTASATSPLIDDTLKTRRQSLGITSEALAVALSIAGSSLRNYEDGGRICLDPELMALYMQILSIDFDQFLTLYRNGKERCKQAHLS